MRALVRHSRHVRLGRGILGYCHSRSGLYSRTMFGVELGEFGAWTWCLDDIQGQVQVFSLSLFVFQVS